MFFITLFQEKGNYKETSSSMSPTDIVEHLASVKIHSHTNFIFHLSLFHACNTPTTHPGKMEKLKQETL